MPHSFQIIRNLGALLKLVFQNPSGRCRSAYRSDARKTSECQISPAPLQGMHGPLMMLAAAAKD